MSTVIDSPDIDSAEVGKHLSRWMNRIWRLRNLYQILDSSKCIVPMVLRPEQERYLKNRHDRNFVPKARKYGMSTIIVIDYLDACIWANPGQPCHAAHVDFRENDAKEKLEIARLAWNQGIEHPDPYIRAIWMELHDRNPLLTDNAGELKWLNGSKQQASTSFMGGTPTRLHISEFGPLSAQQPDRAAKIARGTINAVPRGGVIDIETTTEGGTFGECAAIFKLAEDKQGAKLNPLDWQLFFIPWWRHPDYKLEGAVPLKQDTRDYFAKLTLPKGVRITDEQQAWYESKKAEQRSNMFTQFPSVVSECWYAGVGTAFFDAAGLVWQKERCVGLETDIRYGTIVIQGNVKGERSASWVQRDKAAAIFRIVEHPMPGRRYSIFADCMIGKQAVGSDDAKRDTHSYGAIKEQYIDPVSGMLEPTQIVCMCQGDDPSDPLDRSGDRCPTTEFIQRVLAISIYYGECMVAPEINNKDDIALRLLAAGVKIVWRQPLRGADGASAGYGKTEEVFGWLTDEGSRRQICDNMEMMTREQKWVCSFVDVQHQMTCFIKNRKGRPEAAPGEHDDNVIGPAIGLFTVQHGTIFRGREEKMVQRYRNDWAEQNFDPRGL